MTDRLTESQERFGQIVASTRAPDAAEGLARVINRPRCS
jgi:hypothetical protein